MAIAKKHCDPLRCIICGGPGVGKSTVMARLTNESPCSDHDAYHPVASDKRNIGIVELSATGNAIRELATAACFADLMIVVIDARNALSSSDKRYGHIAKMLGIPHFVVAINKMDLVAWDGATYESIAARYLKFARHLGFASIHCLPVAAVNGDNIDVSTSRSAWHDNAALLELLEDISVAKPAELPFRMLVDGVTGNCRELLCQVTSGNAQVGDHIRIVPSGIGSHIRSISHVTDVLGSESADPMVRITTTDDVTAARGDIITPYDEPVELADQFQCSVLCTSSQDFLASRSYKAAINNREVNATATAIRYRIDLDSGAHLASRIASLGDIAVANITFDEPVPFEPYASSRKLGRFALRDPMTGETTAVGIIHFALRRAANIHWQAIDVSREARAALKGQRARCFWFTGLSGSGKSTIANLLDKRLHASGRHTFVLDGDNVRHGLNRDLGFTEADRAENIRRIAEVARLMTDAGLIVLVSFISPFRAERAFARSLFRGDEFVEVYVDTPLVVCEARDTKGLYAKARAGKLPNFTGLDSPYEVPQSPEFIIRTTECGASDAAERLARLVLHDPNLRTTDRRTARAALLAS